MADVSFDFGRLIEGYQVKKHMKKEGQDDFNPRNGSVIVGRFLILCALS